MSNPALDFELAQLIQMLVRHEGLRLKPYVCSMGKQTIGIGRNLEDVGVTQEEAHYLCANDCVRVREELDQFPWFARLSHPKRLAMMNMSFQLGMKTLLTFKKFLAAMNAGDYQTAASEMLNSRWHTQTPKRCEELAAMISAN